MRISVLQLRRLIREEVTRTLREAAPDPDEIRRAVAAAGPEQTFFVPGKGGKEAPRPTPPRGKQADAEWFQQQREKGGSMKDPNDPGTQMLSRSPLPEVGEKIRFNNPKDPNYRKTVTVTKWDKSKGEGEGVRGTSGRVVKFSVAKGQTFDIEELSF